VGRLGGPSGPPWRGPCPVCLSETCLALAFCRFLVGFPQLFKGTPGLSPTSYMLTSRKIKGLFFKSSSLQVECWDVHIPF
jgi:hypothetical protein